MVKQKTSKTKTFGKRQKRKQQLATARSIIATSKTTESLLETPPSSTASLAPSSRCSTPQPEAGPSTSAPSPQPNATPLTVAPNESEHEIVASASKRKLSYNRPELSKSVEQEHSMPSTIVDLETLTTLFTGLLCPLCLEPSLSLEQNSNKKSGLAVSLSVKCNTCVSELSHAYTSKRCDSSFFDINRRAVAAASATGMGYSGLCNFSELMNIPSLHHRTFSSHIKSISTKCADFSRNILSIAVKKVKEAYPEQASSVVKDIHVSFDGSWQKRGHTSKSGIGLAIERRTGLIVDYEVLTSYCPVCATTGKKLQQENILKYERWLAVHQTNCCANYEGPSGGMEKEAALRIWSRSVIKNGLIYVSMISDGDAKTISEIRALDPYPGINVEKHECVNHVGKRLGTALRSLVSEKSKEKITLGGKGYGKLRGDVISQLQSYYTKAICSNATVPAMKEAVTAIVDHCSSTDDEPHHDHCPKKADSWCFYQKAEAMGLPSGPHKDNLGTPLCKLVADHVRPIFQRMSSDDLLSRCILQSTQNANESAHAVIWARCPKHLFASKDCLTIPVGLGVAEFNFGSVSSQKFMTELNLPVGAETRKRGKKRDHARTVKAKAAVTEMARRHRQIRVEAKQRKEQRLLEKHGQFYVSGGGD